MILLNSKKRLLNSIIILIFGIIIFILGLGNTGLVDETPPLFAAAARAMSESGDWVEKNASTDIFAKKVVSWLNEVINEYKKNQYRK